jgi:TldD protein
MSCTFIEPNENAATDDPAGMVNNGLYLIGIRNGTALGNGYTFIPAEAYKIEAGRITKPVCSVVLAGSVTTMPEKVAYIGRDFEWATGTGCSKAGQYLAATSWGGPHLVLTNIMLGG